MRSRRLGLASAALLIPFLFSPLEAQNGIVRGTVKDDKGNPIEKAIVRIEGMNVKRKYQVKTNKKGEFMHIGVNIQGRYRIIAEKEGYQGDFVQGVSPSMSRDDPRGTVELTMKPGEKRKMAFEMSDEEIAKAREEAAKREERIKKNEALRSAFNSGVEAYNANDFQTARDLFAQAAEVAPDEPNAWANLARAEARLGNHEEAVTGYLKAIELKPDDPSYYQNLGSSYSSLGKADLAKENFAKSAEVASATDPKAAANSYYNMAVTFINTGKNKDAEEALRKALAADETHAEAHYQLGIVLLSLNNVQECIEHLKRYVALSPIGPNAVVAKDLIGSIG